MMSPGGSLNCMECHACCRMEVEVEEGEVPAYLTKTDPLVGGVWMRKHRDGTCVSLKDGACSRYRNRPKVCRDFEIGGELCQTARIYLV